MPGRDFDTAAHEAAHVVVGVALGLRLREACLHPEPGWHGHAWFCASHRAPHALMLAAGMAWVRALDKRVSWARSWAYEDAKGLWRLGYRAKADREALMLAAGAMLSARAEAHQRVTKALLERDLTGRDIEAIARGERLE